MNLIELNRALGQLRLGGIAAVLETRLRQAQTEAMPPIDFLSCLVSDELTRRGERLLERRKKQAEFRDPQKTLDNFDFNFNRKMNRSLVFDLATGAFIARHEDTHSEPIVLTYSAVFASLSETQNSRIKSSARIRIMLSSGICRSRMRKAASPH